MPTSSVSIRWRGYEHEHIERTREWYIALGVFAVCIALISILFSNIFFAILILLGALTLGLLAQKPPPLTDFEISDRGIRVAEALHKYEDILAFWVEEHESSEPLLLVDTTKWLTPNLIIPLKEVEPALVRAYLQERAEEKPMQEPVWHKILELLGL